MNRLARQIAMLRMQPPPPPPNGVQTNGGGAETHPDGVAGPGTSYAVPPSLVDPSTEILLAALRKENETLRNRLTGMERDYVRVTRLNEIYREELIEHRRRVRFFSSVFLVNLFWRSSDMNIVVVYVVGYLGGQPHRSFLCSGPALAANTPPQFLYHLVLTNSVYGCAPATAAHVA